MNKGIIGGIAAAIVIGIIVGVYATSGSFPAEPTIIETEEIEEKKPEPAEKKSFKIELEENMGIKGVP